MIYEKSLAGLAEMHNPQRTLNARQRQVLILIDGKRTQDDLERYLAKLNVSEIINDLERLGFIYNPENPGKQQTPVLSEPPPALESQISAEQLSAVKSLLISSTQECLGIMGRPMAEQIAAASSHEQLKGCISRWHMALRESKNGRAIVDQLMMQVQATLNTA